MTTLTPTAARESLIESLRIAAAKTRDHSTKNKIRKEIKYLTSLNTKGDSRK